jgi:hypothetical protein
MANTISDLPNIIKEIEEIDVCVADLETDARRNPESKAARHNKFAVMALQRYRTRLVADRDAILSGISEE